MKFIFSNKQEEIDNLKKEIVRLTRSLQSVSDKLKNKTAENERILQEKETVLHQYHAVVDQLHKCPPKMEDYCYMNAIESVQKLRAEIQQKDEKIFCLENDNKQLLIDYKNTDCTLNKYLVENIELKKEIERLKKTKESEVHHG